MMEVTYAPNMLIRSDHFGADEFFEIQGTDGYVWVTCLTGHLLDLPPVMLYEADGTQTNFSVDTHYETSFAHASKHFVDVAARRDPARHERRARR